MIYLLKKARLVIDKMGFFILRLFGILSTFTSFSIEMCARRNLLLISFILLASLAFAHVEEHSDRQERFLENKGQWHPNVLYKVKVNGGDFYLEKKGFTYHFYNLYNVHPHDPDQPSGIKGHNIRMQFIGANPSVVLINGDSSFTNYNYFYGKNPENWVSGAKAFSFVKYQTLYEGIDLKLYDQQGHIKYDFILSAGADPGLIKMKYKGANDLVIQGGQLFIGHNLGEVVEHQPFAYQLINDKKVKVNCTFTLEDSTVGFAFPEGYNQNYPLTIDPTLVFSTFSGSESDNWGMTATYDEFGNAYNGGTVFGAKYLIPTGGYDQSYNNDTNINNQFELLTDVAIRKYSSDGSKIYFSTYLGGNSSELVHSMIVDENNELIVFGTTGSPDFPMLNAYDSTYNGGAHIFALARFYNGTDIYATKFSSDGLSILGSTYIGGSGNDGLNYETLRNNIAVNNFYYKETIYGGLLHNYGDQARGEIELDQYGNIYIASQSHSSDFPIVNGVHTSLNGLQDAVFLKLSPDLSNLMYSSYFGGGGMETGISVKIDSNNNIFMAGGTTSADFTTTAGAYTENYQGGIADGYIIKIDSAGQNLLASTYIGTNDYDQIFNLDVDRFGNPYFFAQSKNGGFPAINAQYYIPNGAQLIGKMSTSLDSIIFSTKIGNKDNGGMGDGDIDISPTAFMVDRCQNLYISGWGGDIKTTPYEFSLNNMPITSDAFKSTTHGMNFYIAVIKRNADSLLFGTYFGGSSGSLEHVDGGTSRFDERGVVYQSVCAGCGSTDNFITKDALYPENGSNNCNNAIFKFALEILPKARFTTSKDTGCAPMTVQFDDQSLRANQFFWDFGNNDTTSTVRNPVRTFNKPGLYLVKLGVTDSICQSTDTAYKYIVVYPQLDSFKTSNDTVVCNLAPIELKINSFGTAIKFQWSSTREYKDTLNSASTDSTAMVIPKSGSSAYYYVRAFNSMKNCIYYDSVWVKFMDYQPDFSLSIDSVCAPTTIKLVGQSTGATSYGFVFNDGTSYPMKNNIEKTFTEAGVYQGQFITENRFCNFNDTFKFSVTVLPDVKAEVPQNSTICFGDSILVLGNSYGTAQQFFWSEFPDFSSLLNSPNDSSIKYSTFQNRDTLYFKTSDKYCSDSTMFYLDMERVLLDIDAPLLLCVGDTVILNAVDMSNVSPIDFTWEPNGAIISGQNSAQITSSPTMDSEYRLIGTSPAGCKDTAIHFIDVEKSKYSQANIIASDDSIYSGQSILLSTDIDDPALKYSWSPNDEVDQPFAETTSANPEKTTVYKVEIYDPTTGCTIEALKRVVVYEINCGEPDIFIPTAFTPNADQKNDVFSIRGNNFEQLTISIYNRWGEKIFESNDVNKGWDGSYKGKKADPGVFVYHLHITCLDGQTFFKKGNITLIR